MPKKAMTSNQPILDYLEEHPNLAEAGRRFKVSGTAIASWRDSGRMPLKVANQITGSNVIQMETTTKKKEFVRSNDVSIIEKYLEQTGMNMSELGVQLGYSKSFIGLCLKEKKAPVVVIEYLKLLMKNKQKDDKGDLVVCYVPKVHSQSFSAICSGMGIDAKKFL